MKTLTWAEIDEWLATDEGKKYGYACEQYFRKGYYYGADEVLDLLAAKYPVKQIREWCYGPLWDWEIGDCNEIIKPPICHKEK